MNEAKKIIKEQGLSKPDKKEVKKEQTSRKYLVLIIIGIAAILCGVFVTCYTQLRPRPILTVEGPAEGGENKKHTVNYKDAMYDIYRIETMYNGYGMDWEQDSGDDTLAETTKQSIMDDLIEREILTMQAAKDSTTLTDEDKSEVDETVTSTMENMSDTAKKLKGLSESDVRKAVEKMKLAEREKQVIIDGFDIDDDAIKDGVSKTDFRQYTLKYYMVSKKDETAETSSDSDEVKLKDEAGLKKAKSDMEALRTKALSADDFEGLITDSDNDGADDDTGIRFADHKLIETDEDFLDEATRKTVKAMSNDSISSVLETDDAYYLVKMINNNDSEAYDNEVQSQIENEESSRYQTYYDETLKGQYETKIQSFWKQRVVLGGITA